MDSLSIEIVSYISEYLTFGSCFLNFRIVSKFTLDACNLSANWRNNFKRNPVLNIHNVELVHDPNYKFGLGMSWNHFKTNHIRHLRRETIYISNASFINLMCSNIMQLCLMFRTLYVHKTPVLIVTKMTKGLMENFDRLKEGLIANNGIIINSVLFPSSSQEVKEKRNKRYKPFISYGPHSVMIKGFRKYKMKDVDQKGWILVMMLGGKRCIVFLRE